MPMRSSGCVGRQVDPCVGRDAQHDRVGPVALVGSPLSTIVWIAAMPEVPSPGRGGALKSRFSRRLALLGRADRRARRLPPELKCSGEKRALHTPRNFVTRASGRVGVFFHD